MTATRSIASARALAAARRFRAEADAAEVGLVIEALAWAQANIVTDPDDSATWGDTPVPLAGEGAPMVSEFCVAELAAALGMSRESGRFLLAHVLEIAYRLPKVWFRVQTGELQVWRARRIAEKTLHLSREAAAFVDDQIAGFAHRIGPAATERLVDEAVARYMPDEAAKIAATAAHGRFVSIDHGQQSLQGTSLIRGELDLADALDLEQALIAGAETLKVAGSTDSLDVRRSVALGALARGEQPLPLETAPAPTRAIASPGCRDITLFVHLDDSGLAKVEGHGLLTAEQIRTWTGSSKVTIKPVIDLNKPISTSAYEIPDRIREHVILRDGTCVFAFCNQRARRADIDHIEAFDPDGSDGQTRTDNLAPLCRPHHRLKTFGGWTYTQIEPGTFLWRSPYGYQYLRDRDGTTDLTPRAVDPPGS